jgi:hypothetical protein
LSLSEEEVGATFGINNLSKFLHVFFEYCVEVVGGWLGQAFVGGVVFEKRTVSHLVMHDQVFAKPGDFGLQFGDFFGFRYGNTSGPGSWALSFKCVGKVGCCVLIRFRTAVIGFTWAFNSRKSHMKEVFRTLFRLLQMTCVALVLILVWASALSGVPHVLEAMAYAAVPAVLLAAVAETLVQGSGRG